MALVSDHMGFPNRYVLASILPALLSIRFVPFYQLYLKLMQFRSEPQTYYSVNSIVGILFLTIVRCCFSIWASCLHCHIYFPTLDHYGLCSPCIIIYMLLMPKLRPLNIIALLGILEHLQKNFYNLFFL